MIQNGSSVPLNRSNGALPNMYVGVKNWFLPLKFWVLTKTVINFLVKETYVEFNFKGVWQSLNAEDLQIKPEGQRSWTWWQVHADVSLNLMVDNIIRYESVNYRVMAKIDHSIYGYYEYHVVQDWEGSGPVPP